MRLRVPEKKLKNKIKRGLKNLPWDINSDKIINLLKFGIGIKTRVKEKNINIGQSKFGGLPDLPINIEWPNLKGYPLSFLGQINLSEVPFKNDLLPEKGILFFFLSTNQKDYHSNELGEIYRVIYSENTSQLVAHTECKKESLVFSECEIDFFERYTLPSYQNYQIVELNLSDNDEDLLWEAYDLICDITECENDLEHQLLGNADAVQGDVNHWWAKNYLKSKNIEYNESQIFNLKKIERNMILLLQVNILDDIAEFSKFGASGGIYFGITKEDLKNKQFKNTVFEMQNS